MPALFGILDLGPTELVLIGVIAVLLFGKNLPEVGRSVGKQLGEFRKGLRGIEDEIRSTTGGLGIPAIPTTRLTSALSTLDSLVNTSSSTSSSTSISSARNATNEVDFDLDEPTAPKFEPPPS